MLLTPNMKEFSFEELKMATRNFGARLGDGGLWKVYNGWLDEKRLAPSITGDGIVVAIKDFNTKMEQHFEMWQSEVNFLGRHYHPNLIGLFGYCLEDEKLLLVYEFVQKGRLDTQLFTSKNTEIVILNHYLGIYDLKLPLEQLELLCWVIDPKHPCGQQNLVDWLKPILSQETKLKTIMDARMEGQYSSEAALQGAQLSLRCLELDPQSRPSVKQVMEVLKEIEAL
ncbi:hypothetical protein JRO89_XS08G0111600 [Xanthoceras sorbifolium]|uniref:Protein kinase domain-containing protein n=1 Tax=Xanthoceras sorbifolium TaxID=99658 RepID=A0ABQ8HP97_9ROSI|nr:hypothetical protein JRO89_XS08G0111600 [Xanthoceras sorbifolium]